jgi:hypothetical protein
MGRRFCIEAVIVAIYGHLLVPSRPVEYVIPYSTIMELYEMRESKEPVMPEPEDDAHARRKIDELIRFFEDPFNKKKLERALSAPWKSSSPLLVNENVSFKIVFAVENAQYGEMLDPIETEVVLTAIREQIPVLTDQYEFTDKVIEAEIPVQVFDVEDFEFAVEDGMSAEFNV